MKQDRRFALLLGRAFLHELDAGRTETAVAFGRALLLVLGMKGPEEAEPMLVAHRRGHAAGLAAAVE